jgi:hypothetical protein
VRSLRPLAGACQADIPCGSPFARLRPSSIRGRTGHPTGEPGEQFRHFPETHGWVASRRMRSRLCRRSALALPGRTSDRRGDRRAGRKIDRPAKPPDRRWSSRNCRSMSRMRPDALVPIGLLRLSALFRESLEFREFREFRGKLSSDVDFDCAVDAGVATHRSTNGANQTQPGATPPGGGSSARRATSPAGAIQML